MAKCLVWQFYGKGDSKEGKPQVRLHVAKQEMGTELPGPVSSSITELLPGNATANSEPTTLRQGYCLRV